MASETVQLGRDRIEFAERTLNQIGEIALHLHDFILEKDSTREIETVAIALLARVDTLSLLATECLQEAPLKPLQAVQACHFSARHLRPEVSNG